MSNVINYWLDPPEHIAQDFVSIDDDYDFPFYLSENAEWLNYKCLEKMEGKVVVSEPCLVAELQRLVPYMDDDTIKFHPLNMPYLILGKTEIAGFVVGFSEEEKVYQYIVDDGTGIISILQDKNNLVENKKKREKIERKYFKIARQLTIGDLKVQECPKGFPKPRPSFKYPSNTSVQEMAIVEHNWGLETNNGLFGKKIKRGDYVHAIGYCSIDFGCSKRPQEEITFQDLCNAKLSFLATNVSSITESQYNAKLLLWLDTVVQRRYEQC